MTAEIELTVTGAGKPGRYRILATRVGGLELHRDVIALDSAHGRTRFVVGVMRAAHPGVAENAWPAEVREALERRLLEVAAAPPRPQAEPTAGSADPDPRVAALAAMPDDVRAEAEVLLADPGLLRRIAEDIRATGVVGEERLALALYLVGVSAQLPQPLAAIVRGPTSSGKSFVVERVADLFPSEVVLRATDLTPNALYYFDPGTLRHRWVVAGERSRLENDDRAEATRAMREMIEAGRLSKAVAVKEGDRIVTRLIQQEGPIAYVETTTLGRVFEEDANRCLLLATDEDDLQTRQIIAATAIRAAGRGLADRDRVRAVHQTLLRMLPRCDVIVPFARIVGALFPADVLESRRSFRHLLQLVKAVALLQHRQRERDDRGNVVADLRDYDVAVKLAAGPLTVARGGVSVAARKFLAKLRARSPQPGFNSNEAAAATGSSRSSARAKLAELEAAGLISQTKAAHGNVPAEWTLPGQESAEETGGLPTADQVREQLAAGTGPGRGDRDVGPLPSVHVRPEPLSDAGTSSP